MSIENTVSFSKEFTPQELDPDFNIIESLINGNSNLVSTTGIITEHTSDLALVHTPTSKRATLAASNFYPNKKWHTGLRVFGVNLSPDPTKEDLSVTDPRLVELLFAGVVPELRAGLVRVMSVTRSVGIRSKIAVAPTQEGVDAVGVFVGKAANRVRFVTNMLLGERVDVVAYDPDPLIFLQNALGVSFENCETVDNSLQIKVPTHQYDAAVGGGGLNAALASRLTKTRFTITPSP